MCIRDRSSTVINLVIFTFLVVERVILIQYGVADKTQLIYTLFTLDVAPVSYTHLDVYKRQA